jgi:endoglucanase
MPPSDIAVKPAHSFSPAYSAALAVALLTCASSSEAYQARRGGIVDNRGAAIQLNGVNWFGFETNTHAPHGLWARNWREMLDQMQSLGINALRVPLCPSSIRGAKTEGVDGKFNPELANLNSVELLDKLIQETNQRRMYVVLDHHRPDCSGQSDLWYTDKYPEKMWLEDLATLATRYKDYPNVLGIDLKNEPRGAATFGTGNAKTDWNKAAERAAKIVLGIAPNWLMFVEGIEKNPTCSSQGPHFWGENLEPLNCTPLDIPPDKLILAPHTYGPDVFPQPFFNDKTFPANMPAIWDRNFGQFVKQGYTVMLGEFGGRYAGKDRIWQDQLVDYLLQRNLRSSFYWSWNPNSKDTGGLLKDDWRTVQQDKLDLLKRLWEGRSGGTPIKPSDKKPTAMAGLAAFTVKTVSDWGAGLCQEVEVSNPNNQALDWQVPLKLAGTVQQSWNATLNGNNASGMSWNQTLAPNSKTSFGYCLLRTAQSIQPAGGNAAGNPSKQPSKGNISRQLIIDSNWREGYCARVQVRNDGQDPQEWQVSVPLEGRLQSSWRAKVQVGNGQLTAIGEDYNRFLKGGESTEFGFCAMR